MVVVGDLDLREVGGKVLKNGQNVWVMFSGLI